ncbi:hypothetical protein [Thermoactinospora rubra]|uniref:hypothetical protein n=1 Tax=Thermoactinospora rubra TaxID=1088767 RepID=UPI00117E6D39
MEADQMAFGSLAAAEGRPAPLFDPVDAAFRRVALSVQIRIAADWAATGHTALGGRSPVSLVPNLSGQNI